MSEKAKGKRYTEKEKARILSHVDKVNAAKKVIKMPTCPGLTYTIEERMGGVYDMARDGGFPELVMADGLAFVHLPDSVRPELVTEAVERREGRKTTWP